MKSFAFALLAVLALAQQDEEMNTTTMDDAEMDAETMVDEVEEEVIDSWASTATWDADTGANWEKPSSWGSNFNAASWGNMLSASFEAGPDAEGVNMLTVMGMGQWAILWSASANNKSAKDKSVTGNLAMMWMTMVMGEGEDAEMTSAWETALFSVTKAAQNDVQVGAWDQFCGNFSAENPLDYSKNGRNVLPEIMTDAAAVTAWAGEALSTMDDDSNITGATFTASRPWVPTEERASLITLKNQEPQTMCMATWTTNNDVSGSAEQGCTTVMIDIPVPEVDEVDETDETDTTMDGANGLAATAMALAAVAALAF